MTSQHWLFLAESEQCSILGDPPPYCTFDGLSYRFQGRTLIKTVDVLPDGVVPLVVEGRNKMYTPLTQFSCMKSSRWSMAIRSSSRLNCSLWYELGHLKRAKPKCHVPWEVPSSGCLVI